MIEKTRGSSACGTDADGPLVAKAQDELPYVDSAYTQLMLRYERLMFLVCQRLVDNPDDAREVVQETMVKIFHNIGKFRGKSRYKTWMLQILRRECFTYYRKNRHHLHAADLDSVEDEESLVTSNSDENMSETKLHANKILQNLEYGDRQILILRFIADLQLSEIAEVLNIRLSTAKMRLYRALDKAKIASGGL